MRDLLPPEQRLLAAACSPDPDLLLREAPRHVSTEILARSADAHGVAAIAAHRLSELGRANLVEATDALARSRDAWALQALALVSHLVEVVRVLRDAGVVCATYKGPSLSLLAYGDIASRVYGDVDLIVPRADVGRATRALQRRRFISITSIPSGRERAYVSRGDEIVFRTPDLGTEVDLQWAFAPRPFALDLSVEEVLARAQSITLGGTSLQTPSGEDLMLLLCVHGSKHQWYRLLWVADIAHLISRFPALDWERIVERASSAGVRRMLLIGLRLAEGVLDASLPRTIVTSIRDDPEVDPIARRLVARRLSVIPDASAEEHTFDPLVLRMRERWRDRWRFLVRNLTSPTIEDWEALRLPRWADPAYAVIRPVRLSLRYANHGITRIRSFRARRYIG